MEIPPNPAVSPSPRAAIAPKELPPAIPSVKGQARGFRNTAWKTTPATAMAAPVKAANRCGQADLEKYLRVLVPWRGRPSLENLEGNRGRAKQRTTDQDNKKSNQNEKKSPFPLTGRKSFAFDLLFSMPGSRNEIGHFPFYLYRHHLDPVEVLNRFGGQDGLAFPSARIFPSFINTNRSK